MRPRPRAPAPPRARESHVHAGEVRIGVAGRGLKVQRRGGDVQGGNIDNWLAKQSNN